MKNRASGPALTRLFLASFLAALLGASPAAQAELPPEVVAQALALSRSAASALAPARSRIEVQAGVLDPRLKLAPCARIEPYLPSGVPAWGLTRVGLRCTQGQTLWSVFLPVSVKVWASGVVATAALPAGARLSAEQLGQQEVAWADPGSPPFTAAEAVVGRSLSRAVAAGQPLRQIDLQSRQWFAVGETVRIEAVGDGFSISSEGQALTQGLEGQLARVRTENGRVLSGRAVGERRVEVRL